ncbi:hypothetical protein ABPG74_016492 [Tetrahymena malaccensis]
MSDQNAVLSQSFYLRLQPDRKISISIRYNKKPNGPFLQQDELSMYKQSFNQQIQQRSMSLNKSNLLSRRNSSSASQKKNTLQQLLFKQIEQKPKENEHNNNNNNNNTQQLTTPRKNILNLQFKQETNQQINQILSDNKQKNAITKFKSFLINKQKILNKTEVQTSFDDNDNILTYDSPLKSKNQTEVSNVMYTSPDVNQITPPRCATAQKQVRRRYSNQLLNSVMKDKNRSYSQQNKIIDCKQIPSSSENTTIPNQDIQNASDIDKEFDVENNNQFRESLINQDFIQYFRFFNKKFIENNLKVSLETNKKQQELNEIENTCSADVMMRIQIPEKSKENLSKYESSWKQHYKVQYRYQDLSQSNKKLPFNQFSQKYNISQLIYTPYDLFIIIEDISIQQTKRAVEFLLLNSYENDRVCLIYVQNDQIYNTPLLNCNLQNKNYLKNIISNVQQSQCLKQDQKVSIFERLKNLIEQRFQVNFLTQAIWFSHGVSLKQTTQITYKYNLIDKRLRFQVNIFEYIDENIKSFISKLAFQSSGNYYLIQSHSNQSEQIPFVAETLCQIKRTISFKCSGMVRRLTELEYAQYNQNQMKSALLPKMQILYKYGGQKVWKEDTIFQGNQILIPYLQHNSDYKYYINYQFQLDQQRKYYQVEDQNIPILKVVCLCFLDQIKNSDYIFKQSSLELQFNITKLQNQICEEPFLNSKEDSIITDQHLPDQTAQQIEDQSMFQLKYNCIAMISSLINVKDISFIRNQLSEALNSFLKSYEQYMKTDQYEASKILSLLQELNTFVQQSSVHYCNIMIENVVDSLLRSKNPFFQQL